MIQTVEISAQKPWRSRRLAFFNDEPLRLEISDRAADAEVVFTVASDSGAEPVIEIIGLDVIDLMPATLAAIPEGETYHYNVWSRIGGTLELVERGSILNRRSIAPIGDVPAREIDPLAVNIGVVAAVNVGEAFSHQVTATGGEAPHHFTHVAGTLPEGIVMDATTGALSGMPAVAGLYEGIVLRVSDGEGATADTAPFDLDVVGQVAPSVLSFTASADAPLLLIDGDSIIDYNATRLILEQYVGGLFRKPVDFNQARAGDSTQQILDGVQNVIDLIEPGKTVVLVGPTGANQETGSNTFSEISTQQQQIYDAYLAAGAVVVAVPTLPEEDQFSTHIESDALRGWVYAHQTGGTVTHDGTDYPVSARANFYALDIGTPDRGQTGQGAYTATEFNPYTMKNDQTHPNGTGARYLAEKLAVLLEGLVTSDIFSELGTNLLGSDATFAGSRPAIRTGITGDVPTNWAVTRSGSSTTWNCSKNAEGHLVAQVTNAGNNSNLSVAIEVDVDGVVGDVFDMVVEVAVTDPQNGFRGLRILNEGATASPGDADFYPDRQILVLRSVSAPLVANETTKTFTVQARIEVGASITLAFKRAAVFLVENSSGIVSISGTPEPVGEIATAYAFAPVVAGGDAPYAFDLAAGTLPAGLTLNSAIGSITGTPLSEETATGIALRVTEGGGTSATLPEFSIQVIAAGAPQNIVLPTIAPTSPIEAGAINLTVGGWTNSPTSFEYRWRHSDNVQAGQTGASHVPDLGSAPQTVSGEVRAQNASGWSPWARTGESAPIAAYVAPAVVPWDSAIANGDDLIFSDSDRNVSNGGNGNRHVRAVQTLSGKAYFEVEIVTEVRGIGLADETITGIGTKTLGVNTIYWTGVAILNGSSNNVGGSYGDGDIVQVAVDRDAALIWVRKNGTGAWNGDAGADPTTGALGVDISNMTSATLFPMVSMKPAGQAALHGSSDKFTYAPPSGFQAVV